MKPDRKAAAQQRRVAKQHLAALRAELRNARARRREALFDAKEQCRAERLAMRERQRAARIRAAQELRDSLREERRAVRAACADRRARACHAGNDAVRARAEIRAAQKLEADLRRIAKEGATRRRGARSKVVAESDEDIAGTLPSSLVPLFKHVKGCSSARPLARRGVTRSCRTPTPIRARSSPPTRTPPKGG